MEHIESLRNKLTPFKNYLALESELSRLQSGLINSGSINEYQKNLDRIKELRTVIASELQVMKDTMPVIENILTQMQNES